MLFWKGARGPNRFGADPLIGNEIALSPPSTAQLTPPQPPRYIEPTNMQSRLSPPSSISSSVPSHSSTISTLPEQISSSAEDAIYEMVANEMESGKIVKGLWTRLFAEQDGDEKKTNIAYIKQRAKDLTAAELERIKLKELQRQLAEEMASRAIAEQEDKRIASLSMKARIRERLDRGETGPRSVDGFLDAVRRGDIDRVSQFLNKDVMYVAAQDEGGTGNSALHFDFAVAEKNYAMIRLLVQAGAPDSVRNKFDLTPIDFAREDPKLIAIFRQEGLASS